MSLPCLIQCLYYTNDDMMHLINVSQGRVSCPFNIADESVCVSTNLIRHFDILLLSFCIKYLSYIVEYYYQKRLGLKIW